MPNRNDQPSALSDHDDPFGVWTDATGITRDQAAQLIHSSHKREAIRCGDLVVSLFTSDIPGTWPPAVALLMCCQTDGKEALLGAALKVYDEPGLIARELEPSVLLRAVTDRFGCIIELGKQPKKLFLCEEVDGLGPPPSISLERSWVGVSWIRPVRDSRTPSNTTHPHWQCALLFYIDQDLYRDYLAAQ